MKTIDQAWDEFSVLVVPADAPKIQRQEMKRAFYSGADCMLDIVGQASEEDVTEDAGVKHLSKCKEQLMWFATRVREGNA